MSAIICGFSIKYIEGNILSVKWKSAIKSHFLIENRTHSMEMVKQVASVMKYQVIPQ